MVNPLSFFRSSRNKKKELEDDASQAASEALRDIDEDSDVVELIDPAQDAGAEVVPTTTAPADPTSVPESGTAPADPTSVPESGTAPADPDPSSDSPPPQESAHPPTPPRRTIGALIEQTEVDAVPPKPAVVEPEPTADEATPAPSEIAPESPPQTAAAETADESPPQETGLPTTAEAPLPPEASELGDAPQAPGASESAVAPDAPTTDARTAPDAPIEIIEVAEESSPAGSVADVLAEPQTPAAEPPLQVVDDVASVPGPEKPEVEAVDDVASVPAPEKPKAEVVTDDPVAEDVALPEVRPVAELSVQDGSAPEEPSHDETLVEPTIEEEPAPEPPIVLSDHSAPAGEVALSGDSADPEERPATPVAHGDEPAAHARIQPQIADLVPTEESRASTLTTTRNIYGEALRAVGRFFSAASKNKNKGGDALDAGDVERAAAKLVSGMSREHVGDGLVAAAVGAYPDDGSFIVPHSVNVAVLSQRVARHLGLDGQELETLAVAGLLHDVGTVQIPRKTFYKEDSLSKEEWVLMRKRPAFSAEIIRGLGPDYRAVAEISHQVHERLDGNGYPRGLHVDTIALEASILGAVDIFEAFIHPRPYKKTVPAAAMYGVDNLMRLSHQFGDGVLKALVRSVGLFPVGTCVRLNSGEVARVLRGRSTNPMRPEVEVVYDTQKRHLKKPRYVDLMATPHLYVFKPLSPEDLAEFGLK